MYATTLPYHNNIAEKTYKVRARGMPEWRDHHTVRLEISVGQSYHEGSKLEAALQWAHKNFENVYILLGDSIQHYNLMFELGLSKDEAFTQAIKAGDEWLARHAAALNNFKPTITRWGDWKAAPSYFSVKRSIDKLYEQNHEFSEAVRDAFIGKFVRNDYPEERFDLFQQLSVEYLLEETAIFAVAYEQLGGISAYPGTYLEMLSMFVNQDVEGAPPGLKRAKCVRLTFE